MRPRWLRWRLAIGLLCLGWLAAGICASAAAQATRGVSITEERVALVIGNAAYRNDPLDNPVNDARLIAQSLQRAGFAVTERENLDRAGLTSTIREFGTRLTPSTIAVVYYAGHGLQLRDHNYLIPVDAEIHSEDEIPVVGVDLAFILGRMASAHSRINIVVLDACRNNPYAGKTAAAPAGLAQVDAPVGTLLAFSTAPGKLAADSGTGSTANSVYASYLARHLLTPGLPVETVFKRVREGVLKDTAQQQVPWEHSSLDSEFAFVPGVASSPESAPDQQAAGELAFWASIQSASRADEYRAYLRQYPSGRFAALAQMRIAGYSAPTAAPTVAAAPAAPPPPGTAAATAPAALASGLPHAGDTWRYRVRDQFRLGDLFLTAKVDAVTPQGVNESWTTTFDAKLRTAVVPAAPGFSTLPDWTLTPPEFAPYLQAAGPLQPGQRLGEQQRMVDQAVVPLRASVEGLEDVVVAAGQFRAIRLVLRGQVPAATRGGAKAAAMTVEQIVWYAPEVKRIVKQTVAMRAGTLIREQTTVELMDFKLN